jgi:hypothetical protein
VREGEERQVKALMRRTLSWRTWVGGHCASRPTAVQLKPEQSETSTSRKFFKRKI